MKVALISLGCSKNRVDSECLLSLLLEEGFLLTNEEEAEAIIINTCAFIRKAVQESLREIRQARRKKKIVAVVGCLPQRWWDRISSLDADVILGVGNVSVLPQALKDAKEGRRTWAVAQPSPLSLPPRRFISTFPYAYLKIADGCDNLCHYCTIPLIRGRFRSRREEEILQEAEELVEKGIKEIVLVAQETTRYGLDIYGELTLPRLLVKLTSINARWLRIMYMHPQRITDELLEVMANSEKIVKYLDIPLQHSSPKVLRDMGRWGDGEEYLKLIRRIRQFIPSAAIRSTFMIGFPTETEEDFQHLLRFLEEARLDRVGFFLYSREEETIAGRLSPLPSQIARERLERAVALQARISYEKGKEWIGKILDVLVERRSARGKAQGRSFRDAPEVDGVVYITSSSAEVGEIVPVEITQAMEYDLKGVERRQIN